MKRFPSAIIELIFTAAACNFMKKKYQIITTSILLLFFSLLLINVALAQERPLEAEYPEIQGFKPETVATNLPQYVKYIFNFAIAIVGMVAFGVLVWAGIRYLTSVGNPEELKKSKKRILAVILGLLILLFSYLILTTINPQLVIFRLPGLTPALVTPATTTTPISEPTPDVYEKIRILVNALSQAVNSIESQTNSLKDQLAQCDCSNANSMCICQSSGGGGGAEGGGGGGTGGGGGSGCDSSGGGGGGGGGSGGGGGDEGIGDDDSESSYSLDYCGDCEGLYCYNAPDARICSDETAIKSGQQALIALRDEILYHKNRFLAEKADLLLEIDQLKAEIEYYAKKIEAENNVLQQLQDENARKLQQDIISAYEKKKEEAEAVKFNKEELIRHFDNLAKPKGLIYQLAAEIPKASDRVDECLKKGVQECSASCDGGCHDTTGCFPEDCSGGNPSVCSIDNYSTIQNLKSKIDSEIQAILDIIGEIKEPTPSEPPTTTTPTPTTPPVAPPVAAGCPSGYKFDPGISKQCQDLAQPLFQLLTCMSQKMPKNVGRISSISDSMLYSSPPTCSWEPACPLGCKPRRGCCSHSHPCNRQSMSCHYGGQGCYSQHKSYAVDFGDEKNASALRSAAIACDNRVFILDEGDHIHMSIGSEYGCQCDK